MNYAGNALVVPGPGGGAGPGVLRATKSLTGPLGAPSSGAIPPLAVASLLLVGGLTWRRGAVPIETGLAHWVGR